MKCKQRLNTIICILKRLSHPCQSISVFYLELNVELTEELVKLRGSWGATGIVDEEGPSWHGRKGAAACAQAGQRAARRNGGDGSESGGGREGSLHGWPGWRRAGLGVHTHGLEGAGGGVEHELGSEVASTEGPGPVVQGGAAGGGGGPHGGEGGRGEGGGGEGGGDPRGWWRRRRWWSGRRCWCGPGSKRRRGLGLSEELCAGGLARTREVAEEVAEFAVKVEADGLGCWPEC